MHNHHHRADQVRGQPLYVLTTVFNPMRFRTRYSLYEEFRQMVEAQPNAVLYTVEVALGDREFAVTCPDNPRHLQLRTLDVLWNKERATNLLERRLPNNWKYLAWIDADVHFTRPDWVQETIQQLQHYQLVQMWSEAVDISDTYEMMDRHQSFCASYMRRTPQPPSIGTVDTAHSYAVPKAATQIQTVGTSTIHAWHPGFAWAINRDAWETVGGLFDLGILGAGDNHMAKGLVGDGGVSCHPDVGAAYMAEVLAWQTRAQRLQRDLGCVNGLLYHHWHGPKVNRRYWDRWKILVETQFDPNRDLYVDSSGLYAIRADAHLLRDKVREYFAQRNEDAVT